MENNVVTVTTAYPGASARLICFITTPLEKKIAKKGGIDYLTSQPRKVLAPLQPILFKL
jgi:multidrug efflux pump subunit AcrB